MRIGTRITAATALVVTLTLTVYAFFEVRARADNRQRAIESEADRLMLETYRDLYGGKYEATQMFLVRDFFEILEKAIDRCREAGVVVYQVVLKNS